MDRLGIIGIVVRGDRGVVSEIQAQLTAYSDVIIGRMGVPDRTHGLSAISVIVEGNSERISALTAALGRLNNVNVKSAMLSADALGE